MQPRVDDRSVVRVSGRWIDGTALFLALAVLGAWLHPAGTRPLTWDEVDYVVAARAGTWANLIDQGAMGPLTFARFSLAKTGRGDAQAVADASGYVEDENLLSLRHWHPPGGLMLLAPAVAVVGAERGARLMQLGWAAILGLMMLAMLRDLAPKNGPLRAGGVMIALLDPLTRHSLLEAHVHVAVAVAFLLPLWAWLRATRDPLESRRLGELREAGRGGIPSAPMGGRAGALVLGLTLGVLWSAAVVGPLWTVLWLGCLLIHRDARDWLFGGRGAGWMLGGTLAALFVLWPGAFFKLSLVQTYALRLYAVVFQGGREWGSAGSALGAVARQEPALVFYALVSVSALVFGLVRARRDALSTGAAATVFLAVIVPFAIIDRYLLPLVPLAVLCGVALVGSGDPEREAASPRSGWGAAAGTFAILLSWALGTGFSYPDPVHSEALRVEYARVERLASRGVEVLAEGGHMFRYYGPSGASSIKSVLVDYDGARLLQREGIRYDTVSLDHPAWIVLQQRSAPEPTVVTALTERCRREDFATHVHFACGGVAGGEPYVRVEVRDRPEAP